jgi:peptidyl-prolyl cis-trans isomerase C
VKRRCIVFAVLALAACKEVRKKPDERVIVELVSADESKAAAPEVVITELDYRRSLARARLEREGTLDAAPLTDELKSALLDRMIDERLLLLEATKQGVRASTTAVERELEDMRAAFPDPKAFDRHLISTYQTADDLREAIRDRLVTAKLLERFAFAGVNVAEPEARALWDSMPENEKIRPARVHAAQIVLRTEEEGREVQKALKKGQDFAELAKAKSVAPEGARGGDLGWFEAGVMPTVFDEVCFALKPGEVSELTPSEYGFHIFKLLEAEAEVPLSYEEARPELIKRLREEALRKAETAYVEGLRAKVRIVRNEELLASIQ